MESVENQSKITTINMVIEDLSYPFKDFREDKTLIRTFENYKFSNQELFYCLIDETERTFKRGMIISATVTRVIPPRPPAPSKIICRLENGLDAVVS